MTNPFYTKTGNPGPNTQGRSGPIRDEFALVEAGFDAVDDQVLENVERALRLPIGDDGDLPVAAAAREHLFLTFDANGAPEVWPPNDALGRANKVVAFDENGEKTLAAVGSGYSWLPSMAGKAGYTMSNDGVEPAWRGNPGAVLETPTGNFAASADLEIVDPASFTYGEGTTLPDARTLRCGFAHIVELATGYGLYNNDGSLLATGSGTFLLALIDNSTQNGVWRSFTLSPGTPKTGMDASVSGPVTTMVSTMTSGGSVVEISSGVYLVAAGAGSGGIRVFVATVSGFSVSIGAVTTVGADALLARSIELHKMSSGYACLYATASGGALKAIPLSVAGTAVTAGTVQTVVATLSGELWHGASTTAGNLVMVTFADANTVVKAACLSYAANAITVGAAITLQTAANTYNSAHSFASCFCDATSGFIVAATREATGPVNANNAYAFTVSGTTITAGAGVSFSSVAASSKTCGVGPTGANGAIVALSGGTSLYAYYVTKAGTVTTLAGSSVAATITSTARLSWSVRSVGGVYMLVGASSATLYNIVGFYLNGSTPTAVTNATLDDGYGHPVQVAADAFYAIPVPTLNRYTVAAGVATNTDTSGPSGLGSLQQNTSHPVPATFIGPAGQIVSFALYAGADVSVIKANY